MVRTKAFLMTSVVLIAFTSTLISVALFQVHARSSSVIFVEPGQSIAQAVNNAQDGDRLIIKSGSFNESMVLINKSLSIVGESSENTIVDGGRTAQVIFQVVANDVLIQNLTLQNTDLAPFIFTAASAVTIFNATGVIIRNVSVQNASAGVVLRSSNLSQISCCSISGTVSYGIYFRERSCNNVVVDSTVKNNSVGIGFADMASQWNRLYHNNFQNNTQEDVRSLGGVNYLDDGYPSGGNYWDDCESVDLKNGRYQDQNGSDGILDQGFSSDNYPLANPLTSVNIEVAGQEFVVEVSSNFEIISWDLNVSEKSLRFFVTGPQGTVSEARVNIPKGMLSSESLDAWNVSYFNGDVQTLQYLDVEDVSTAYLHFTFVSTEPGEIRIVGTKVLPEFGPLTMMLVFFLLTAVVGILLKRRSGKS
jgi:nitrous oxidase accessory protein NosD